MRGFFTYTKDIIMAKNSWRNQSRICVLLALKLSLFKINLLFLNYD